MNVYLYCRAGPVTLSDPSGLAAVQPPATKPETVLRPTGESVAKPASDGGGTTHADLTPERAAQIADRELKYDPSRDQGKTVGADTDADDPILGITPDAMYWRQSDEDRRRANPVDPDLASAGAGGSGSGYLAMGGGQLGQIVPGDGGIELLFMVGVIVLGGALVAPLAGALGGGLLAWGTAGALVGAGEGLALQGIDDLRNLPRTHEFSDPGTYAKSAGIGALFGGVSGLIGGVVRRLRGAVTEAGPAAVPRLKAAKPGEMLQEAVNYLKDIAPELRVEYMADFAQQIKTASRGAWSAKVHPLSDGGTLFAGDAGRGIAISPTGQMYKGFSKDLYLPGRPLVPNYAGGQLIE